MVGIHGVLPWNLTTGGPACGRNSIGERDHIEDLYMMGGQNARYDTSCTQ